MKPHLYHHTGILARCGKGVPATQRQEMKLPRISAPALCALLLAAFAPSGEAAWQLHRRDGAGGTLQASPAQVTKTNGVGLMDLAWSRTFAVKSNANYVLRLPYRAEDASLANLLLLRYTLGTNDTPKLDEKNDDFAVWTSQSLVRNSPPGQWDTRFCTVHAERDGDITVHALLYGNPCTVEVGEPAIEDAKTIRPRYQDYADPFSEEQVKAALAERSEGTADVRQRQGRATLFVNGKPALAMLYKGINATKSYGDYAEFAAAGVNLATVGIATGDTTGHNQADTKPVWLGKDRFAFERIDAALLRALRRNTNAQLILDIRIQPYKAWGMEHPDEIIRNTKGQRAYAPCSYVGKFTDDAEMVDKPDSGKWWYPSWQSEVWRADLERVFTRIAEHVQTSPYGKAVVGFFIYGNDDGQFVVHYHDHSEPTQWAFRAWLDQKYGSLDRLNTVWKTSFTNASQIQVPAREWPSEFTHYAPGPQPDFREFKERNPWEVRERLAAALKRAIGRPVVVMAYASPYYHAFVDCPHLDAIGMQPDYAHRRNGFPIAFNPLCADDVGDKLLFTELDLRSHTGEVWPTSELYLEWVSVPKTAKEWRHIHRKVAGFSIANGYADWYYDMGQYFNDPEVHAEIGAVRKVQERLQQTKRRPFRPDVCVVVTETDRHFLAHEGAVIQWDEINFNPQGLALAASGVPFERHYLKDIMARKDLQDFKVYVFLQNAFLGETERRFLRAKLQNRQRTLVWVYNSGYLSEAGKSVAAMSDLIGIRLATDEKPLRRTMAMDGVAAPRQSAANSASNTEVRHSTEMPLRPFFGGAEMYFTIFNWGEPGVQPFWVEDSSAIPLAHYVETQQVAAARKQEKGWTSIYIGAAQGLSDDLLNRIAREAGAYVAGPPGQQIHLNGNFASIHALRSGDYAMRLPPGCREVLDADTGKTLARGVKEFRFPVVAQQTYWFLFQ